MGIKLFYHKRSSSYSSEEEGAQIFWLPAIPEANNLLSLPTIATAPFSQLQLIEMLSESLSFTLIRQKEVK